MDYWYKREHKRLMSLMNRWAERAEKSLNKNLERPYEYAMNKLHDAECAIKKFEIHFGRGSERGL